MPARTEVGVGVTSEEPARTEVGVGVTSEEPARTEVGVGVTSEDVWGCIEVINPLVPRGPFAPVSTCGVY